MVELASLSTMQIAIAFLLAVPTAVAFVVLLLALLATVGLSAAGVIGWALTRASATVLGESGKIWR